MKRPSPHHYPLSTIPKRAWHVVIMAGGLGERLWPLTGSELPKPLLPLRRGGTLLSATIDRAVALVPQDHVWVVTSALYGARLMKELPTWLKPRVIIEPQVRGTATCIAIMAHVIAARDPRAGVIVLPSDHWITPLSAFRATCHAAMRQSEAAPAALTCIGIPPARPSSGYGYIHHTDGGVTRFTEKPSMDQAAAWIREGSVLWNAGMFTGLAAAFQAACRRHVPALAEAISSLPAQPGRSLERAMTATYAKLPVRSFDREVLERHDAVAVVPATFTWNDVGSWAAWPVLEDILDVKRVGLEFLRLTDQRQPVWLDSAVIVGAPGTLAIRTKHGLLVCHEDAADHVRPPAS